MKQVRDKMIKEQVRLIDCQKGDHVCLDYKVLTPNARSSIIVEKVKLIPGNKLQIKYRNQWERNGTIKKVNVPADTMVERTRKWRREDGEDKGFFVPNTITVGGMKYNVDPEQIKTVDELPLDSEIVQITPALHGVLATALMRSTTLVKLLERPGGGERGPNAERIIRDSMKLGQAMHQGDVVIDSPLALDVRPGTGKTIPPQD